MGKGAEFLMSVENDSRFSLDDLRYSDDKGGLLEVSRDLESLKELTVSQFETRMQSRNVLQPFTSSGVWRYREAVLDAASSEDIVSLGEGNTPLFSHPQLDSYGQVDKVFFKHEGYNPTGSFKDRGMTVAVTQARRLGLKNLGCASTGNTSASLASYAASAGMNAFIFIPKGKITGGKLAQALAYGAKVVEVDGSFDTAMDLVQDAARELGIYLVNSINPFRLEGQKTIMWELFQELEWKAPDWILCPGGNLGNTSAFGKAIHEAYELGWIKKKPKICVVQAEGASPFFEAFREGFSAPLIKQDPETVASAMRIGNPVNYPKALKVVKKLEGAVLCVTDEEILKAKEKIDGVGIGCEPASAASLAGLKKARESGLISKECRIVCILTGHVLKDTDVIQNARDRSSQFISFEQLKNYV